MIDDHRRTDEPIEQKVAAERDEEFVVFQIGLRINAFRKVRRWLPIFLLAPRMVRELTSDPEAGLLGSRTVVGPGIRNIGFIQYWESFEALRDYARDSDRLHFPAWQDYYEDGTKDDAAVGIWHETFVVGPDEYETVYNNMPPYGLAAIDGTEIVPASDQRSTAAGRLGHTDGTDSPLQATDSTRGLISVPQVSYTEDITDERDEEKGSGELTPPKIDHTYPRSDDVHGRTR